MLMLLQFLYSLAFDKQKIFMILDIESKYKLLQIFSPGVLINPVFLLPEKLF